MNPQRTHFLPRALAAAGALLLVVACSSGDTPKGAAEKLIEGDLATQLGLGKIAATCETPPDRDAGTTFTCASPTEFGTISWLATMADKDNINVESTNLVKADVLPDIERVAVASLEQEVGQPLGVENFHCGDKPVVLSADNTMVCALTDPADPNVVYDATVTVTDLATGAITVAVSDTPR